MVQSRYGCGAVEVLYSTLYFIGRYCTCADMLNMMAEEFEK